MSNQLVITCPIFNVDTKVAACVEVRNRVWAGKHVDVRKGCQACMASSKCPIAKEFGRYGKNDDFSAYESDQPRKGKLGLQVLEEIRPIIVQTIHLDKYAVSTTERNLIASANDRIEAMMGSAPRERPTESRKRSVAKPAPRKIETSTDKAAASGDLSAAISNAA